MTEKNHLPERFFMTLLVSFIIYTLAFRLSSDVKVAIIAAAIWVVASFFLNEQKKNYLEYIRIHHFLKLKVEIFQFLGLLAVVVVGVNEIIVTPGMAPAWVMNMIAIGYICCCIRLFFFTGNPNNSALNTTIEYNVYFIVFLGILTGHGVRDSYPSHIIVYSLIGLVSSYVFVINSQGISKATNNLLQKFKDHSDELKFLQIVSLGAYFLVALTFCFFSLRTDILAYTSPVMHWSYFTSPAYELGFQSIVHTLSQYSITFGWVASKISINPHYAVWLGQVCLLNIVFWMGLWIIRKSRYPFLLAIGFGILVLFADPSSVGPQAYPSSSVVRFFPFYLAIFAYCVWSHAPHALISRLLISLTVIISFIWSPLSISSLIASISMLVGLKFARACSETSTFWRQIKNTIWGSKNILYLMIAAVLFVGLLSQFTHLFAHQFYYVSDRYGWQSSGSIWIVAPMLFTTLLIIRYQLLSVGQLSFLLAMPLIASFAYFSYRPLSHNVLAVFPLIFISLVNLHQSFSAHARILKQNSKVQNLGVYLTATKNLIIVFLIFAAVSFSFQIPDRTQSPFSLKNIIENNLNGLSNVFFEIDDPERACKKNEANYQEFLSEVSRQTGVSFPENTPFIVLADFLEVSRFGNCFMNDKDEVKQRRIFYSSPLYNAPLPTDFSKELIKDYLTRHNTEGFFVFTSKRNKTALHFFNSFMDQVPEEFKKEDITILDIKSDYFNGARVDAVSLELQYYRK